MSLLRREILSIGILGLSGCSALGRLGGADRPIGGPSRWETYGRGPAHRSNYDQGSIPTDAPTVRRSFELRGSVATSPVASEDYVAVGDETGVFVVPFADEALPRWVELPERAAGTPCLDGRTIYAPGDGRRGSADVASVSAVTPDEETIWRTELSADVAMSPTHRDGTVFVRSGDAYLALDAKSGETRWRNRDASRISPADADLLGFDNFAPAAGSDVVVFPDADGIAAADPNDGTIQWRRELRKVRSCPVLADGTVFAADVRSGVHAFDAESGEREWKWSETGCWAPPAVSNDAVYATAGSHVFALDRSTGDPEWRTAEHGLHGGVQSGIAVVGETILASSTSALVNVRTESENWTDDPGTKRWMRDSAGYNAPIVVDDRIAFVDYGAEGPVLRILK